MSISLNRQLRDIASWKKLTIWTSKLGSSFGSIRTEIATWTRNRMLDSVATLTGIQHGTFTIIPSWAFLTTGLPKFILVRSRYARLLAFASIRAIMSRCTSAIIRVVKPIIVASLSFFRFHPFFFSESMYVTIFTIQKVALWLQFYDAKAAK